MYEYIDTLYRNCDKQYYLCLRKDNLYPHREFEVHVKLGLKFLHSDDEDAGRPEY